MTNLPFSFTDSGAVSSGLKWSEPLTIYAANADCDVDGEAWLSLQQKDREFCRAQNLAAQSPAAVEPHYEVH